MCIVIAAYVIHVIAMWEAGAVTQIFLEERKPAATRILALEKGSLRQLIDRRSPSLYRLALCGSHCLCGPC